MVGPNSNQAVLGDYAWTMGDTKEAVSLLQGLQESAGDKIMIRHAEGCDWWSRDKSHIAEAVEVVRTVI